MRTSRAERGESESDDTAAYKPRTQRTWTGAGFRRTGAGQDVSESDRAGALHTADRDRSRTHDRAVKSGSDWAGAGQPAAIPVLLGYARIAVRQEATSKDQGLCPMARRPCPYYDIYGRR